MTRLFAPLSAEFGQTFDQILTLIDRTFPLPGRFRAALPKDVAELSRLLTSDRKERGSSYLGKPALLSAYLRYFLPWNIFRLTRLLNTLPLDLKPNDAVNDIGAGPLTFAISLWLCRLDLRAVPLEFRCIDKTPAVLETGKKLFAALTADSICKWTIKTIKGELRNTRSKASLSVEIKSKPAALSVVVNVYNELFWNLSPHDKDGLMQFAYANGKLLLSLTERSGFIFVMEPGIPRSGEFISLLRAGLINEGRNPIAPCTHFAPCPLAASLQQRGKGGKAKWCHFAFDTEDAPEKLHRLSVAANIPKERAVLSFILTGPASSSKPTDKNRSKDAAQKIRVISDSFPVGDAWGRYGCCEKGLVLVRVSRRGIDKTQSGGLVELALDGTTDTKSGALVALKGG